MRWHFARRTRELIKDQMSKPHRKASTDLTLTQSESMKI